MKWLVGFLFLSTIVVYLISSDHFKCMIDCDDNCLWNK